MQLERWKEISFALLWKFILRQLSVWIFNRYGKLKLYSNYPALLFSIKTTGPWVSNTKGKTNVWGLTYSVPIPSKVRSAVLMQWLWHIKMERAYNFALFAKLQHHSCREIIHLNCPRFTRMRWIHGVKINKIISHTSLRLTDNFRKATMQAWPPPNTITTLTSLLNRRVPWSQPPSWFQILTKIMKIHHFLP